MISVLAGTLGAGNAVAQDSPEARPQAQARSQTQAQPQPKAGGTNKEYSDLYTRTIGNIRNAMRGDAAVEQHGSGYLIDNPDSGIFQQINIGGLADRDDIAGGAFRGLFRRSDNYLLGFYVAQGDRQTVYTFTENGSDMIPANVFPGVQRSRFPFRVTYSDLPEIRVDRSTLSDAVRLLFDHDPNTSNAGLRGHVETLAVALAEGARFTGISAQIAQLLQGGLEWRVGNHADEIQNWSSRSEVVVNARREDPTGTGPEWLLRVPTRWNGAMVWLSALDLARRIALVKPTRR
ncbi:MULTISPECIES: ribosome-inactivating family protein [Streptomyces]|uniref:Ribosome-inactivating family protein n=1 Tax=Streptomyces ramulosus TaxID=47762 RepID=A0ABW1FSJ9_9ACTN